MASKTNSDFLQERERYYNANSDTAQARVLMDSGQELVSYRLDTAIRIWYNDLNIGYAPHWHSALEIVAPVDNWYDIKIGETTYHTVPGDIMIIPPGELHTLIAPKTGSRFIFLFDLSVFSRLHGFAGIQSILSRPIHLTRSVYPQIYDEVYGLLTQIREEYFIQNEFAALTIYSLLLNFFVKIGRNHLDGILLFSNIRAHKQREYADKFNSVMDYIDSHYMDELKLDDIASSVGFSKYHFSRLFKQYTNYTFCAYICYRRIKVAEELLEQSGMSITEVAMKAGFPSISTFNRLFKQSKGCSPSEYREKNNSHLL